MKPLSLLLTLSLLLSALVVPVSADAMTVDLKTIDGITYVPFRSMFEKAGFDVSWDDYRSIAAASKDGSMVEVKGDLQYFMYNGVLLNAKSLVKSIDGSLYMPTDAAEQVFLEFSVNNAKVSFSEKLIVLKEGMRTLKTQAEIESIKDFAEPMMFFREEIMFDEAVKDTGNSSDNEKTSDDFSGTNNQETGIDEADFVKVDNQFIYTVRGDRLMVIKADQKPSILHDLKLADIEPTQLFVTDDKIVVMGYSIKKSESVVEDGKVIDYRIEYDYNRSAIYVYDKANLANTAPTLLKKYFVDGNLEQGRNIGDNIYLVLSEYNSDIIYCSVDTFDAKTQTDKKVQNIDKISYYPGFANSGMIYTVGINLKDLTSDGLDIKSYMGDIDNIYVDKDNLYISSHHNNRYFNNDQSTHIFKYALNDGKVEYQTKGSVKGYLHNQFSMGTNDNHLRVAVTHYDDGAQKSMNNLYVLDKDMKPVGSLKNLAPGERIYSVRMMGEKVYMVTYRQVDPFYVIDTSEPADPKVLGYLKIPGYSSYLHPYDEHTIIGVGMNTKIVEDNRVVDDGVKVSLFDVTDVTNPIEKDKMIFAQGNSYTEVGYDHKAFLFNKAKGVMALPISSYGKDNNAEQSAHVFGFKENGMLDYRGNITHNDLTGKGEDEWFADINRIFYIGDNLYTMSYNFLKVNNIQTLNNIGHLKLVDNLYEDEIVIKPKVKANLTGYITEITPDGRVRLNNDRWVSVDDETSFAEGPDNGSEPIDKKFKLGNFIQGYTENSTDDDNIYAMAIYSNEPSDKMASTFTAIITQITDDVATVKVIRGDLIDAGASVHVDFAPYFKSIDSLQVGDTVKVYHANYVMESSPLNIDEGLVIK